MKQKHFLLLVVAALVLAAVAWILHRGERASWQDRPLEAGDAFFEGLPVNDVALVRLKDAAGHVTLRRGEDGWTVDERGGYPANFRDISDLILLVSRMQARQVVPVTEGDLGQLELRQPGEGVLPDESGLVLDLEDSEGSRLASLVLGKTHFTAPTGGRPETTGTATGRYVLDPERPGNAYLVMATFDGARSAPSTWLDRSFVTPGMARRVAVEAEEEDRSWVLEREQPGGAWSLLGLRRNQTLDASRVLDVDTVLSAMMLADVTDGPEDARAGALEEQPVLVDVETFDGVRYKFTVGAGRADNLPVRVEAEMIEVGEAGPVEAAEGGELAAAAPDLREEKLAQAARFHDRVVFVPRNFFEPFLVTRSSLVGPPAAAPE